MKNIFKILSVALLATVFASSCVTHRDTRTEIFNENSYLDKDFLTRSNPNHEAAEGEDADDGWLMGLSVTAVSLPAPMPDIFPGLQADVKYVRFAFSQDTLQLIDGIVPGPYNSDGNLPDPLDAQDAAPRVIQEYAGNHVDIRLRRNLDGEVTNYVEEYMERDWQDRQFFKTDLHKGSFSDLSKVSWYYDLSMTGIMTPMSVSMVPDSLRYVDTVTEESNFCDVLPDEMEECEVDWDQGDYIEWTTRVTYKVDARYSSLMNFRADIDTQTIDYKYSLWRRPDVDEAADKYVARKIDEKDRYKRKFGIWDYIVRNYQDPNSGLIGSDIYMSRFNPNLPINFYKIDVPAEYEEGSEYGDVYASVADYANDVFEMAEVKARVAFHDQYEGNIIRQFGDIRYSFVVWHNNSFSDIPWLGYGPSWMDPRSGETFNATLNFNNWMGLHYYTMVVKDLLAQTTEVPDDWDEDDHPWNPFEDDSACKSGTMRKVFQKPSGDPDNPNRTDEVFFNTTLYSKMKSYMQEEDPTKWVVKHSDEPDANGKTFLDYYHMLLGDLRFFYPPYQTFVYSDREATVQGLSKWRTKLLEKDNDFWELSAMLEQQGGPLGIDDFTTEGAIEETTDFVNRLKEAMVAHQQLQQDRATAAGARAICLADGPSLLMTVQDVSQKCVKGKWQTYDEWEDEIRWRIAHQTSIHELGHNLGQWHNFYGSVDHLHYQKCDSCEGGKGASSSVMDYVHHFAEVGADLGYYPYDKATLIYGYRYDSQEEVGEENDKSITRLLHPEWSDPHWGDPKSEEGGPDGVMHPERSMLFANDYHRPLSPLVDTFDLGTTPSEIVYNSLQYYDWMYKFRNFRAYRQYWETWGYPNYAFAQTFPLRRFLDLWGIDFWDSEIENELRILGVEGDQWLFSNIRDEFAKEMGGANRMVMNYFRAILTQSNAERSYATTYDSFFGDVTRMGIIYDKLYAMFSFVGLFGADNYNWDVYALLAYYEGWYGNDQAYSDARETLTTMLGGAYDVYPWFLPTAVAIFAQDTNNISFADQTVKEWIGFRSFERVEDMTQYFGFDPRNDCIDPDGTVDTDCPQAALGAQDEGHQTFYDADGGQWVYLFMWERNLHLCASVDLSPISYKQIWDYNEAVNINNSESASTYTIRYFYDYYKYYN